MKEWYNDGRCKGGSGISWKIINTIGHKFVCCRYL